MCFALYCIVCPPLSHCARVLYCVLPLATGNWRRRLCFWSKRCVLFVNCFSLSSRNVAGFWADWPTVTFCGSRMKCVRLVVLFFSSSSGFFFFFLHKLKGPKCNAIAVCGAWNRCNQNICHTHTPVANAHGWDLRGSPQLAVNQRKMRSNCNCNCENWKLQQFLNFHIPLTHANFTPTARRSPPAAMS